MKPVETFGQRLKRYRLAAGLTQQDLSARAGLAGSTIQKAERDEGREIWLSVAVRLADAVGVSLDVLAGRK